MLNKTSKNNQSKDKLSQFVTKVDKLSNIVLDQN